ncbi:MAG TPA: ABC transporter substrate-binding protein [Vicinamibacteria bacterium]|nr:ABC transporter substrate-binding protein [Vicinamibacteria bacterium]
MSALARFLMVFLIGGLTGLSACGSSGDGRTHVRIGLPVAASTFLPLYLADEERYFEDEGLDVELVVFRGGSDLVRGVVAGSIDVGVTSLAGVTVGISAGQPLKAFWAGYNLPAFDWYAVPSISSLDDVKGKRFGVTRYGSSTDFLTRYVLVANGIDPDADVQIVQGGDSGTRLAAMQAGQLDVNIFNPPETFIAEDRGYKLLLTQRSLAEDYPFHVFFATETYITGHGELLETLLRAHVRGVRLMKNDKVRALRTLEARSGSEYAERTYDAILPFIYEDGRLPSERGLEVFFQMGGEAGRFDEPWPLEKYWTPRFRDSMDDWLPR